MTAAAGNPSTRNATSRRIVLACLVLSVVTVAVVRTLEVWPARPSPSAVVLVTIDTLRADFVSFSGHHPETTPFLNQLAQRGVVFTKAYAPSSWTAPSMASLFTSLAPTSHGIISEGLDSAAGAVQQEVLPASLTTLAESFKHAGYQTVGVPANRHLAAALGFAQGFDFYYGAADFLSAPEVNEQVAVQLRNAFGPQWTAAWKARKTFVWMHYFDPHDPYFARQPWISRYAPDFDRDPAAFPKALVMTELRKRYPQPGPEVAARIKPLYESEISYVDDGLRRLGEQLAFDDNVLLIVTSDHGEEIADHGRLGHSNTLYEELIHVPMLLHWPAGLPAGLRIDSPVSLLDIYPTLVELLGLSVPAGLQGQSLVPLLRGRVGKAARPLYFELHLPRPAVKAVRDGEWKLIREDVSKQVRLFDLARDAGEQRDVAAENRDIVRRLEESLTRWLAALPAPPSDLQRRVSRDAHLEERLRALGYLD